MLRRGATPPLTPGAQVGAWSDDWRRCESPAQCTQGERKHAPRRARPGNTQRVVERQRPRPGERQGERGDTKDQGVLDSAVLHKKAVAQKILSTRLKELETRGIVARQVDPGPPVKVVYRLTDRGQAFEHVMEAIERWGRDLIADDAKMRRRSG